MMAVPSENNLYVNINGNQSHDKLVSFIQAKQEVAPIRQHDCTISVRKEFGVQHPLFSFIQSMPTLECVQFSSYSKEKASIDAFLDAIIQNHSIHSVDLFEIDCSAYAILQLMERKMKWKVQDCHFMEHPSTLNKSTSYIEELNILNNHLSVMDFMASFCSWPLLCQLSIGIPLSLQVVHLLQHIIPAVPVLQELTFVLICIADPDVLQSCATIVFNAPSPDLKLHLNQCRFHANTMAVLKKMIKSENAKSMRVQLIFRKLGKKNYYKVLRTIMSESSRVGNLVITVEDIGSMLKILPLLRRQQPFPTAYYPCTSIHLIIHSDSVEQYRDIIESIPHWTPHVKKLFPHFAPYGRPSRPFLRTELVQAVRNNMHLQLVKLVDHKVTDDDDELTKNADEECRASLERYCERNKKLHATLDEADSIPLYIWPYVFHLASRGGAAMLYRHLRENAGYTIHD